MSQSAFRRVLTLLSVFLGVWLGFRYLLPVLLPFLLGLALALGAEPMVRLLTGKLRLPRGAAAGIGVTLTLVLVVGILLLLSSLLVRELGVLAGVLPDLEDTARQGMTTLEDWLLSLAARTPEGIRNLLTRTVLGLFSGGGQIYDQVIRYLPGVATGILSHIPDGALSLGTAIFSAFLISVRLPRLRDWARSRLPEAWKTRYLPMLRKIKNAILGWLKAQAKLAGVTFLIVTGGLLLLQVSYAPLWAAIIALVDAVPLLGTGIVLIPWSLVCFLQGNPVRALGLLGVYAAAALTRSALEPRLVGRQLGLDPLVTLVALYLGYQIWGVTGMLLSPLLAVTALEAARADGG